MFESNKIESVVSLTCVSSFCLLQILQKLYHQYSPKNFHTNFAKNWLCLLRFCSVLGPSFKVECCKKMWLSFCLFHWSTFLTGSSQQVCYATSASLLSNFLYWHTYLFIWSKFWTARVWEKENNFRFLSVSESDA